MAPLQVTAGSVGWLTLFSPGSKPGCSRSVAPIRRFRSCATTRSAAAGSASASFSTASLCPGHPRPADHLRDLRRLFGGGLAGALAMTAAGIFLPAFPFGLASSTTASKRLIEDQRLHRFLEGVAAAVCRIDRGHHGSTWLARQRVGPPILPGAIIFAAALATPCLWRSKNERTDGRVRLGNRGRRVIPLILSKTFILRSRYKCSTLSIVAPRFCRALVEFADAEQISLPANARSSISSMSAGPLAGRRHLRCPARPAQRLGGARDAQAARRQGLRPAQRIGPRLPLQPGGVRHRREEIGIERNRPGVLQRLAGKRRIAPCSACPTSSSGDELDELEQMIARARKAKGGK